MKRALISQMKTKKSNIIVIAVTMIIVYIVGIALIGMLVNFDDTATRYIVVGTPMALGIGLFANFFMIIGNYIEGFQTGIAMGRTRKTYIIANYILECLIMLGMTLITVIMYFVEKALGKVIYVGYEYNSIYEEIFSDFGYIGIVAIIILVIPITAMFIATLYQKFGKIIFWIIWGAYMIFMMFGGRLDAVNFQNITNLILTSGVMKIMIGVALVAIVLGMAVTTMSLSLKQEVKNY